MVSMVIPYLDLNKTYKSSQGLRWIKLNEDKYIVIYKNRAVKVQQKKQRFIFNCSEDEFFEIWYTYFGLGIDYEKVYLSMRKNKKMKPLLERTKGLRIVQQDLFETMIMLCINGLTIDEIRYKKELIAEFCGIKHKNMMREAGRVIWFEFPTAEMILKKKKKISYLFTKAEMEKIEEVCKQFADDNFTVESRSKNERKTLSLYVDRDFGSFPIFDDLKIYANKATNGKEKLFVKAMKKNENRGFVGQCIMLDKILGKENLWE